MWDRLWDFFVDILMRLFLPAVCSYYAISGSLFLNVSVQNASGLEAWGNTLLTPVQYLLAGREAIEQPDGTWKFIQKFDYTHSFWTKTISSLVVLSPSLIVGSLVKALSYCNATTRNRFLSASFTSNIDHYVKMGLQITPSAETLIPHGYQRRPGDENILAEEKKALRNVGALLSQAKIPWWVDCGTCLGTYRYGGSIPWDEDIDIAVLLPDFENVFAILNKLDPKEYLVQDWSTRENPHSYIKIFIRKSGTMIDIYHFAIEPKTGELRYVFSLDSHMFFPEWFKIRERRFKEPVAIDTVFPLKRALFDGIEVFVPNDTKKYLQRVYGENLNPVKIYNPKTNRYEKDLTHPYWQRANAH